MKRRLAAVSFRIVLPLLLLAALVWPGIALVRAQLGGVTVGFEKMSVTVGEKDGTAKLNVVLSASPSSTVTVNYATSDGMATAPADYTNTSGTLTFMANTMQLTQTI